MSTSGIHNENNVASTSDTTVTTAVGALVIVLAIISVSLRFYTRYFTRAGFGWDDWLILLALIATILTDVLVLWCLYPFAWVGLMIKSTVLYFSITSATKMSILFMYNRIFSVSRAFRFQVLSVGAMVMVFWIGCTVANLLNCRPLKWTWLNSLDDPRYCFNYNIFWMASGCVEAFIDVLIITIPIRMTLGLHLNKAKKFALTAVFLIGIFVIITGVVKVALSYAPGSREPSFNQTEVWATVHCGIGMVCACLPVCWPLILRVTRFRSAFVQRHWHKFSISSLKEKFKNRRNTTTQLERTATPNTGDHLFLDSV